MAGYKTIKILINDDGTVTMDQEGWTGKSCSNDVKDLINALGKDTQATKKDEYFKEEQVQLHQRY